MKDEHTRTRKPILYCETAVGPKIQVIKGVAAFQHHLSSLPDYRGLKIFSKVAQ